MARKTKISKEVILEAAFQKLIRDGYASINITSLAKEIGCSTQPIAWHFDKMEGLREELRDYCVRFVGRIFCGIKSGNIAEQLENIAAGYVTLTFDYPNLYRYFYMSDGDGGRMKELTDSLRIHNYDKTVSLLQKEYDISEEEARRYLTNLQMYVHGIASYTVTWWEFSSKEEVMKMIHQANEAFLAQVRGKNAELKDIYEKSRVSGDCVY